MSEFQSSVNLAQAFGVIGELITTGPVRSFPAKLVSDPAENVIGRAYTWVSEGVVKAGGVGAFAGILANPKVVALAGTAAGGTLAPSLVLPDNAQGEIVEMGTMYLDVGGAGNIGDLVIYDTDTGELALMTPGDYLPSGYAYAYGVVREYTPGSNGLAVIDLNYSPSKPVSA